MLQMKYRRRRYYLKGIYELSKAQALARKLRRKTGAHYQINKKSGGYELWVTEEARFL